MMDAAEFYPYNDTAPQNLPPPDPSSPGLGQYQHGPVHIPSPVLGQYQDDEWPSPPPDSPFSESDDYGPDEAQYQPEYQPEPELLPLQPELMQFPPSSPMSTSALHFTSPLPLSPGWPHHTMLHLQPPPPPQQQQSPAIGKLASRPGDSGKMSARVHVGDSGGSSTSASDDTDFGPHRRARQARGRDYTSDADEDDTNPDGKISLGKPNSRSEFADSFDTTERKVHAAAVLNNPELLMMYAQSFNDSIPGVRLHFTRIMCGYDQPAPPSPKLSAPHLRQTGVPALDNMVKVKNDVLTMMRLMDEREEAAAQAST